MKPIDLFDAMDGISEKYIRETEQAVAEHSESRTLKQQKAADAPTVNNTDGITAAGSSGLQKRRSRKEETGMNRQPFIQRITTGIAAAAACAVFAGGGWFIAQQAKQNQPEPADNLTEEGVRNFLGGTGEIHVAVSQNYPLYKFDLMYDDTKVYFYGGKFTADRNAGIVSEARETDNSVREILSHTLWDGEQFYYQDGSCLYRMDMSGKRDTENAPFYEIDPYFNAQCSQDLATETGFADAEISDTVITGVKKLRENEYVISLSASISGNGENIGCMSCAEICRQSEEGQTRTWEPAPGWPGEIILVKDNLSVARSQSNGRFISWNPDNPTGIPTGVDDPAMAEMLSSSLITLGSGDTVGKSEYGTAWAVHDNSIYYLTETVATNKEYEHSHYAALDIYTGDYTDMGEAEFDNFIPLDDEILYVTRGGKAFYSSDYELSAPAELFVYDNSVPAEIQEIISQKWDAAPLRSLDAADEHYASFSLDCFDGSYSAFALYDRTAGEMHYYKVTGLNADDAQNYTDQNESEAQSDAVNALGGNGTLYPVDWTNHGGVSLLRDNGNYYHFDTCCWYVFPLTGGQFSFLRGEQDTIPLDGIISDGERIYSDNLDIISDGSAENCFDPSAAQEIRNALNAEAEQKGWWYHFEMIWHIRDRYFIVIRPNTIAGAEITADLAGSVYEVWTDDSGRILSEKEEKDAVYYCSDDKREMYAVRNGEHELLDCPGYEPDEKPDPTAYGTIIDAYCVGDEEYYITADNALYTRENGQPVLIEDGQAYGRGMQLAPDRRFFYLNSNGSGDALYEWKNGEKALIYQPESDKFLFLCGFEPNESGGYSIIVYQWDQEAKSVEFVFIDADTHEIVKQAMKQFVK